MDQILELIKQPFVWGLAIGLALMVFTWKTGMGHKIRLSRDVRRLENELRDLQGHLNTQLKINAQGNQTLQDELDELRNQNENLRVSIASLQSKPGRGELRQYQVTEIAVRLMREQAPGFAPAWEKAVREAEGEVEAGESGIKRLVRKVIPNIGMGHQSSSEGNGKDSED